MKKLLVLLLCVVTLSSCTSQKKCEKTVFSMDTQITMTAYGENGKNALELAEEEIKRIDKKFKISNMRKTIEENDEETQKLLHTAFEIGKKTDSAFDIRIAPVMRAWGFYSEEFIEKDYKVPTDKELNDAILKMQEGNDIDLGGIAKGYCADRVVEILKNSGITSAVLSLGGNVSVIGKKPDGTLWNVGIKSPFDDEIYAKILIEDTCLVTSGDYIRYFEKDGKHYHHIINPKTGYPADSGLSSVTVISKNSTVADALSTALFVMGKDKAIEYWKKDKTFQMVLIDKTGKIYYTDKVAIDTAYEKEVIEGE